jgi:hypothetical protein
MNLCAVFARRDGRSDGDGDIANRIPDSCFSRHVVSAEKILTRSQRTKVQDTQSAQMQGGLEVTPKGRNDQSLHPRCLRISTSPMPTFQVSSTVTEWKGLRTAEIDPVLIHGTAPGAGTFWTDWNEQEAIQVTMCSPGKEN